MFSTLQKVLHGEIIHTMIWVFYPQILKIVGNFFRLN